MKTGDLDSATYKRNLEALKHRQPTLARLLAETSLPAGAELVQGRDGSPTFRIRTKEGNRSWLGHSSMPQVSSPALLAEFNPGGGNVLLPTIGHGHEVKVLLQALGQHQAIYTWDQDATIPALTLRLHDFSADILRGRLVLAIHTSPHQGLLSCFEDYPTHLPPAKIFAAPHLDAQTAYRLQTDIEQAAAQQHSQLLRRLQECHEQLASRQQRADHQMNQLLIASTLPDPYVVEVLDALAHAASQLDLPYQLHTADRPENVHLLRLAQKLVDQPPDTVVLIDQVPEEFGDLLRGAQRCVTWCISEQASRPEMLQHLADDKTLWIGHPHLTRKIKTESSSASPSFQNLGPAADPSVFHPCEIHDADRKRFGSDVAIVLDAISLEPEDLGLTWESHKTLLREITQLLRRKPARLSYAGAEKVLDAACQAVEVQWEPTEARQRFIRLIAERIAPTVTVLELIPMLIRAKISVKLWGTKWELHPDAAAVAQPREPSRMERNLIYNASGVVLCLRNDSLTVQALLDSLASGGLGLVQKAPASGGDVTFDLLAGIWGVAPHFVHLPDGFRQVKDFLANPQERALLARQARSWLLEKHLMKHRLQRILKGP